jgi:phosphatidate cytidylyltransferase
MSWPTGTTSTKQFVTKSAFEALAVEDGEESEEELVQEEHARPDR